MRAFFSATLGHIISLATLIGILKIHEWLYPGKEAWNILFFSILISLFVEFAFIFILNRAQLSRKICRTIGQILKSWFLGVLFFLLLDISIKGPIAWTFPKIAFIVSAAFFFFDLKNLKSSQ